MIGKKQKIFLVITTLFILLIITSVLWQTATPKEDKREWFTEKPITIAIMMHLHELGYDYEDIGYINTEKIR